MKDYGEGCGYLWSLGDTIGVLFVILKKQNTHYFLSLFWVNKTLFFFFFNFNNSKSITNLIMHVLPRRTKEFLCLTKKKKKVLVLCNPHSQSIACISYTPIVLILYG